MLFGQSMSEQQPYRQRLRSARSSTNVFIESILNRNRCKRYLVTHERRAKRTGNETQSWHLDSLIIIQSAKVKTHFSEPGRHDNSVCIGERTGKSNKTSTNGTASGKIAGKANGQEHMP